LAETAPHPGPHSPVPYSPGGPISRNGLINYVHRNGLEVFVVLYLLLLLYCTFVPFGRLDTHPAEAAPVAWLTLSNVTFHSEGLRDILPNILLYVPLGTGLYLTARRRSWPRILALIAAASLSALISIAAEWSQQFAPPRVASWVDVASNTVGGWVGALMGRMCRRLWNLMVGYFRRELRRTPLTAVARAYVALLIVTGVIPLDFTFDASRIGQAAKNAQLVPFGQLGRWDRQTRKALATDDRPAWTSTRRERIDFWLDQTAEAAAFGLLGLLMGMAFIREHAAGRFGSCAFASLKALQWASLLSVLQFFVLSRGFDTTDILVRTTAACAGALVASATTGRRGDSFRPAPRHLTRMDRNTAALLTLCIVAYILCRDCSPFALKPEGPPAHESWREIGLIPFAGYFLPRISTAADDILYKFLRFAVFGAAAALAFGLHSRHGSYHRLAMRIAARGALLSLVAEIAQIMIPTRYTDLTHILLAASGSYFGAIAARWARDYYRAVRYGMTAVEAAQPVAASPESKAAVLNADIPAPGPDAPVEPAAHERASITTVDPSPPSKDPVEPLTEVLKTKAPSDKA